MVVAINDALFCWELKIIAQGPTWRDAVADSATGQVCGNLLGIQKQGDIYVHLCVHILTCTDI